MLRPCPESKQEVRQISLPKLKTTAKTTPARYSFLKYRQIFILLLWLMKIFLQLINKKKNSLKIFTFVEAKHRSFLDQADHSIDLF